MNKTLKFSLAVVLQIFILLAMIGLKSYTLKTGTPVLLKIQPVDPRSLFRGDYLTFNFEISRLSLDKLDNDLDKPEKGDKVWLALAKQDKYWQPQKLYNKNPRLSAPAVILSGYLKYVRRRKRYTVKYTWRGQEYTSDYLSYLMKGKNLYVNINLANPGAIRSLSSMSPNYSLGLINKQSDGTTTGKIKVSVTYDVNGKTLEYAKEINESEKSNYQVGDSLLIIFDSQNFEKVYSANPAALGEVMDFHSATQVTVIYGIEDYYIPEASGQEIGRRMREAQRDNDLAVEVKIDRFGQKAVSRILTKDGLEEFKVSGNNFQH